MQLTRTLGTSKRRPVQDVLQHTVRKVAKYLSDTFPEGGRIRSDKASKKNCSQKADDNGKEVDWDGALALTRRKLLAGGMGKGGEEEWGVFVVEKVVAPRDVAGHHAAAGVATWREMGLGDGGMPVGGKGLGTEGFGDAQGG